MKELHMPMEGIDLKKAITKKALKKMLSEIVVQLRLILSSSIKAVRDKVMLEAIQ